MLGFDVGRRRPSAHSMRAHLYADSSERERSSSRVREDGRLEHHRGRLRRRDGAIVDVIETVVGEFDAAASWSSCADS